MPRKLTAEHYHAAAFAIGYEWLGQELPRNNKTLTLWRCVAQHEYLSNYQRISHKHGCPDCAKNKQKTIKDYLMLAARRGFTLTSREITTVHAPVYWRCERGHEFKANYRSIDSGDNCPYCSGRAQLNAGDYAALAESRGFIWLGEFPQNAMCQTNWQCQLGHSWSARYNDLYNGQGCPDCKRITLGNLKRSKPEVYRALAESHGLEWIGTLPPSIQHKTKWRCKRAGHVFETTYGSVAGSISCPACQDRVNGQVVSYMQRQLHAMIGGELNYPLGRRRIDIAFPDDKIAVEYDCYAWHTPEKDASRDNLLLNHGWRVLHVRSGELLPTHTELDAALTKLLSGELVVEIILDDWRERQYNANARN
jgi:Uncharacterized protein conserved in bacteria